MRGNICPSCGGDIGCKHDGEVKVLSVAKPRSEGRGTKRMALWCLQCHRPFPDDGRRVKPRRTDLEPSK